MKKNINNLDFDDLIRNFNLKKFIKYLDKQCKYKFKISPLPWMDKKFPDVFNDLVSSSLGKNITHKKLLDGIYKNEGDFIHAAIENGTLLKNTDSNFKLERSINIRFDEYESNENDSEVIHYKMLGGGHWWDYSLDNDLKTSSLLWDFFSKHSKK